MKPPSQERKPGVLSFILLGLIAVGFPILLWQGYPRHAMSAFLGGSGLLVLPGVVRAAAARFWPTVNGRVVRTGVRVERWGRSGGGEVEVHVVGLEYRYHVAGREYCGDILSFSYAGSSSANEAQAILARYPEGTEARVRFNPEDPALACLETPLFDRYTFACLALLAAAPLPLLL